MDLVSGSHMQDCWKLGIMGLCSEFGTEILKGILKGLWENLGNLSKHFPPFKEPCQYLALETFVEH